MNKYEKLLLEQYGDRSRMTASKFWSEFALKCISFFCALIVMIMILSASLPVSTKTLTQIVNYSAIALAVLWCIPIVRNTRRRLRDAGHSAKAYLWLLLPVLGWIWFIILLCTKSVPAEPKKTNHN